MRDFYTPSEEELNQIAIACSEDERLREILGRILSFSEEERESFRQKMTLFFIGAETDEDIKAKRVFSVLIERVYAEKIGKKVALNELTTS
ncbi:MAG TPA: hypothetical protein PLB79_09150 [Thermotogota bacterium]|jgi:hypothetical protein|nr:hypothetical protein [Thermotogota bacterium]OQC32483.1 MAG: hypothetical protein BWX67_00361 [Thermotogota bacterium ADurb.Bin062]HNW45822.1 hypothetical protein [Thermotogota bacterium]HNY81423.1 hypothetical protein [Thermotogota bacterium]HOD90567.1 hypothetical protein [Thermotogota bacterium]